MGPRGCRRPRSGVKPQRARHGVVGEGAQKWGQGDFSGVGCVGEAYGNSAFIAPSLPRSQRRHSSTADNDEYIPSDCHPWVEMTGVVDI